MEGIETMTKFDTILISLYAVVILGFFLIGTNVGLSIVENAIFPLFKSLWDFTIVKAALFGICGLLYFKAGACN